VTADVAAGPLVLKDTTSSSLEMAAPDQSRTPEGTGRLECGWKQGDTATRTEMTRAMNENCVP
jgi:hypothetical protein